MRIIIGLIDICDRGFASRDLEEEEERLPGSRSSCSSCPRLFEIAESGTDMLPGLAVIVWLVIFVAPVSMS
jgi:hypothetical protein